MDLENVGGVIPD